MAHEIRLEAFSLLIVNRNGDQVSLNDLPNSEDFIKFFEDWVKFIDGEIKEYKSVNKTIELDFSSLKPNSAARLIRGIVIGGYFGTGGNQKHIDTKTADFKKTARHTDETPFYYLIHAPLDKKRGMLLIQTLGSKTISDLFRRRLQSFFRKNYKGYTLSVEYYISKKAVKQFISNNDVKAIVFRRHALPSDIADQLNGYDSKDFTVELKIANNKSSFLGEGKITKFINDRNTKFFTMPALDKLGFDGKHDTFLEVKNGTSSVRLVNLNDIYSFKPQYSVDGTVLRDADSNPTFDSIDAFAQRFLIELEQEEC